MKLLLDHNLSHKLVSRLADIYPGSTQTRLLNFGRTGDSELWFVLRGAPPKIVWLRIGNCTVQAVEAVLRRSVRAIADLVDDPERIVLELVE